MFFAANPELKQLGEALVSIHYEPEDAGYLGIAQHLHWNGFGGDGKYLTLDKLDKLEGLQNQAFDYHGTQETGLLCQHFTKRLEIFGQGLAELRTYTAHATTNALKGHGNNGEPIHIYDLCTGPKYGAVADTVTALQAQGKKVALTLSDVGR